MQLKRTDLLAQLESVMPGLSDGDIIEQSSCFIFKDKKVITFNDEIACQHKCLLKIEGAIQAMPLVSILRKLRDDTVEINTKGGELVIEGKNKKSGVRFEKKISLPIDTFETPKKWVALPKEFTSAISLASQCSGKDDNEFTLTCVHLHPDWIESSDGDRAVRYRMKMGIGKSTLVRCNSIKHIVSLKMTEFSETANWIHFKSEEGMVLSCRRYLEAFPEMSHILKVQGIATTLPKGLKEVVDRAEIFSKDNDEDNFVIVKLKENRLKITGRGMSGWFSEIKKIKYDGAELSFTIAPKLLSEIARRYSDCVVAPERLKVKDNRFEFVACLNKVQDKVE